MTQPRAKPIKPAYRRNLPHLQREDATLFITFNLIDRTRALPPAARDIALHHCMFEHEIKHHVHVVVIMPDHAHMITTPMADAVGNLYGLEEIMKPIKGVSSRRINQLLGRRGRLWQDESFDHILRSSESLQGKSEYVAMNPVRWGLVATPDEYRWLWRDWVDGAPAR